MKKLLMLSALAFVFTVPVAQAGQGGGHKGGKMFERHDINGDGVVTKAEFLESAEAMFAKLDLDGNGEVTKEETKKARAKMKSKFQEHKQNRDGQSTEEE